jgi:hypothetical protein
MSDDIRCEVCGAWGRRRMGRVAPEGWFWAEVFREDENHRRDTALDTLLIVACSIRCALAFWFKGPGQLVTGEPCRGEAAFVPRPSYEDRR